MTTMMTTLTVLRPRGQRKEVFHDTQIDRRSEWDFYRRMVRVHSYRVEQGNVLKIYSHKVEMNRDGHWDADDVDLDDALEVAHFRPNQWDSVRSGS